MQVSNYIYMSRIIPLFLFYFVMSCTLPAGKKDDAVLAAAVDGDAKSQMKMGLRCDEAGQYAEAVEWYMKAAEQGLSEAQNNLGVMYKDGVGVARDYAEAVRWFMLAARQGNVLAQSNLGWMYQAGRGVTQNYDSARHWYMQAALRGHAAAQNNLGTMYRDGLGLKVDSDSARFWFEKADRQQLPQARRNLERLKAEP